MRSEATISRSSPSSYISRTLPRARSGRSGAVITPSKLPTAPAGALGCLEVVGELREHPAAVGGDEHERLQAAAAEARPVAAGLDRDDVPLDEVVRRPAEVGPLVDLEADAVPERVEVARLERRARRLGEL